MTPQCWRRSMTSTAVRDAGPATAYRWLRREVIEVRRREFVCGLASAAAAPCLALAQDRAKVARIGYLGLAPAAGFAPRVEALRAGLRDLGYVEGRNLSLEFRWAESPQQMPQLAAELVRAGVDVIFAPSSTETGAALETTKTVPVVFTHADPVGVGHVASPANTLRRSLTNWSSLSRCPHRREHTVSAGRQAG